MLMKNKKVFLGVLTGACFAMAMTMPSCPGQQAMQQQIDTLQTGQQDLNTKIKTLETQLKVATSSSEDGKKMIEQLHAAVLAQKGAIDNMSATIQQMDAKIAALSSPKTSKAAPAKSSSHRKH